MKNSTEAGEIIYMRTWKKLMVQRTLCVGWDNPREEVGDVQVPSELYYATWTSSWGRGKALLGSKLGPTKNIFWYQRLLKCIAWVRDSLRTGRAWIRAYVLTSRWVLQKVLFNWLTVSLATFTHKHSNSCIFILIQSCFGYGIKNGHKV